MKCIKSLYKYVHTGVNWNATILGKDKPKKFDLLYIDKSDRLIYLIVSSLSVVLPLCMHEVGSSSSVIEFPRYKLTFEKL